MQTKLCKKKYYKSNTEVRLVYTKSLSLIQNASVRYSIKPNPSVAKEEYIKNILTFLARIPNLSATLEETAKPYFSKK